MNYLTENGKVYENSTFDEYAYDSIYNQIIDELKSGDIKSTINSKNWIILLFS